MLGDALGGARDAGGLAEHLGGALDRRPPTKGLTATTGALASVSASRIPGRARIGPIEAIGFEGPITIVSASRMTASASGVGDDASAPRYSTPSMGPRAPSTIMNS